METRITSWNNDELFHLTKYSSHKVVEEYGKYIWYTDTYHRYRGAKEQWTRQMDKEFTSESKARHYIAYNIASWSKELFNRVFKESNDLMRKYNDTVVDQQMAKEELYEQIREVKREYSGLSQKRLAEHFNVSISTIKRALRK